MHIHRTLRETPCEGPRMSLERASVSHYSDSLEFRPRNRCMLGSGAKFKISEQPSPMSMYYMYM